MAAIAGIVHSTQTGRPTQIARDSLLAKLADRGSAGVYSYQGDSVSIVYAHAGTGKKTHTFRDSQRSIVVAGDIRIDNRDDIQDMLGSGSGDIVSDADLAAKAFERWGPSGIERIIGDFALAIWDTKADALYCFRDHFGIRPLFYEKNAESFSFASEAKFLPGYRKGAFTDDYLGCYLAQVPLYEPETAHPNIFRLMPGHWLRFQNGNLIVEKYWELEIKPINSADPAREFRRLFDMAVNDRMEPPTRMAALLSGGLDSSAITCVAEKILSSEASEQPLRTYSMVYEDNPPLDERPYINDVLATGHYDKKFLPMQNYQPLTGAIDILDLQEGPFGAQGLLKTAYMYEIAANDGIEVILDGHGGDEAVGYGTGRLWELANSGRWIRIIPLVRTVNRLHGTSSLANYLSLLERFGSEHLYTRALRWIIRQFVNRRKTEDAQKQPTWERYLTSQFIEEFNLRQRSIDSRTLTVIERTSDQHYQLRNLVSPLVGMAFEMFDKTSAVAGLETRFPFFDKRLVEFSLGLASSEKLRLNQTRSILRRALKDIYPPSVARRQDKTDFMPELATGLVKCHSDVLDQMVADRDGKLAQYMDMDKLRDGISNFKHDPLGTDGGDVMFFWRVAMLHIWMADRP